MKVLITDDAAFMRMKLKDMLTKENHEVVGEAADGLEALELYQKHNPDIVTMDITMPNMNGIEALKKILEINPNAKVIMCSAMGQETYVLEAIKSGAKDFIVKPFQQERIREAIEKVTK